MEQLAGHIKAMLDDPVSLCAKLDLLAGSQKQARGLLIRCPFHGEKRPSCSVTRSNAGTIRVKCFACDAGGDALTLVAHVRGLPLSGSAFNAVLAECAELAGDLALAEDIRRGIQNMPIAGTRRPLQRVEMPEPSYAPVVEVEGLWRASEEISKHQPVASLFMARGIDPGAVEDAGVVRVIQECATVPRWASYHGVPWSRTHRAILPTFDATGTMAGLRAWRTAGDGPKRLPPAGYKSSGLALANRLAVKMLRGLKAPSVVYVVEGEPDFLIATTDIKPSGAVFGIGSGSWTQQFADAIDRRCRVVVATHSDSAGDKYAAHVLSTLENHPYTWRWSIGSQRTQAS